MKKEDQEYIAGLFPAIVKIKDEDLREKVIGTWYRAWKRSNFARIEDVHQFEPARKRIAYTNVDHTNQVVTACERVGEVVGEVVGVAANLDYLLAGAVLHDVDKIVIFDSRTGGFSETGRRFAHAVMGASLALQEGLPEEVAHIIGAHSVRFSPVPPSTVEACIVRQLDHVMAQAYYAARGLDSDRVLRESLAAIS